VATKVIKKELWNFRQMQQQSRNSFSEENLKNKNELDK
jgi:hypothetical protein